MIKTLRPACITTKCWLVGTSCKPRKFSHPAASQLSSKLPESKTSRAAGGGNSIESRGNSEADWRRANQEKGEEKKKRRIKEESKKKADYTMKVT